MFGSAFALLTLGIIIIFVKVPYKEQYQLVRRIGIGLVVSYLTLSVFSFLNASTGYTEDMDYISLVVASVQAAALTWVMVALISPGRLSWRFLCWQTVFAALMTAAVTCICAHVLRPLIYVRVGAGILYLFQCYLCMLTFRRAYRTAVRRLEAAYDDWVRYRLRWARWGFYCGVLVGVIAYMVIGFGEVPSIVFVVAYMAYYVMLTIVYIDYVNNLRFYEPIIAETEQETEKPESDECDEEESDIVSYDLPYPEDELANLPEEIARVQQALDTWVEHKGFCSECTIADIAEAMNVSVAELRKYVKSNYGEDFRTWRIQLRITEACRLLIERRDMPINQVGEAVGIPNKGNFSNYFSRITGMTPKQYRDTTPE